jgi:hypothetical protein
MMNRIANACGAALALCAVLPPAHAGQQLPFNGLHYYSARLTPVPLDSGHSYILLNEWRGFHAATNPSDVTHKTRLECTGHIDSRADGTFSAEGYCNHWDRDGDLWVGHWWNNSTMPLGRYEVFSGQGKYAGASGGGTSKCDFAKPPPEAQVICEVNGTIELK